MKTLFLNLLFVIFFISEVQAESHLIPVHQDFVDGDKLRVLPGDTLLIEAGERRFLQIRNISGNEREPIVVMNHSGAVIIDDDAHYYGLYLSNCSFFKLTGSGKVKGSDYGFQIRSTGPKANGLSVDGGSTDFEIEFVEVKNAGFAGIMAKSDPDCDEEYTKDNFVMKNVSIHDNYIHHSKGEGIYIGNSFYGGWDRNQNCPGKTLFPHEIHNLKVFNNKVEHVGWDGIQVGCATEEVYIYDNLVIKYGLKAEKYQSNGIQVGEGTRGVVAGNVVAEGKGNGMIILGKGENLLINNLLIKPGENGFFCDSRITDKGSEFVFANNTIVEPAQTGFMIYSKITDNKLVNNIVISNNDEKPFVDTLSGDVPLFEESNLFLMDKKNNGIAIDHNFSYSLSKKSPAYGNGQDISHLIEKYGCQFILNELKDFHQGYLGN
ncbi:right-handed parallel beta-helix repeat-containing protein [Cytophagaceae bacterium ABcell3]|nr:right-handed parallel beta-helix repeat-containing protein [Cytophagaceae bacterium ABcell3]